MTSIGYSAFGGCTSLTSVVIPDSVASIGDRAFYNCSVLTSVTIPKESLVNLKPRREMNVTKMLLLYFLI